MSMGYVIGTADAKERAIFASEELDFEILSDEQLTALFGDNWHEKSVPGETWVKVSTATSVFQTLFGEGA
jgi:hypothetical protein